VVRGRALARLVTMTRPERALKDSFALRWGMLVLQGAVVAVVYYFYDALAPLKGVMEQRLGFSSTDFGLIMSAAPFPNVFLGMAVIAGIMADRLGIRLTGILVMSVMLAGGLLTWYGCSSYFNSGGIGRDFLASFLPAYSPPLKAMAVGMFLFGFGIEAIFLVCSKAAVKWFSGGTLALALGIQVSIARLGTAAAMFLPARLVEPEWTLPVALSAAFLGAGLLAFIAYAFVDKRFDEQQQAAAAAMGDKKDDGAFRISDVGRLLLNPSFLAIAALCVTFYSAVMPFMKFAPDLIANKYSVSPSTAGLIVALLPFGTIVFTPMFAWVCDHKGRGATLMIVGSVLLGAVHLTFALTSITPYVPIFVLGIAFSLIPAAMWPSLAKIVPQSRLGSAYGLIFTIQNIGLFAFPNLMGKVLDSTNPGVAAAKKAGQAAAYNYTPTTLMLAAVGLAALGSALALKWADRKQGYGLEKPNKMPQA